MAQRLTSTTRLRVYGIVQGVGFRPFVSRLAGELGLCGSVANKGSFVEIFVQGDPDLRRILAQRISADPPPRAAILKLEIKETEMPAFPDFTIAESIHDRGKIFVSPDIAVCERCLAEMRDPADRRYRHAFINCTACGPRVTILDAMPYDRVRTAMKDFPMCKNCSAEYDAPESRRYDAQPVCCPQCGPRLSLLHRPETGEDALLAVQDALLAGKIAAVKGIGGFHLCCNAADPEAIRHLRRRKHRPQKPFAVMMRDLETVRKYCECSPEAAEILTGHQKPVVLLPRKNDLLPENLAPGNPYLGVMLPYTPLHWLLFHPDDSSDMPDVLVMTSGNVSGAPICRTDEDAAAEIAGFCDVILTHDRPIRLRADDSVMEIFRNEPYMIRRSRGYAPLPVALSAPWRGEVLGIGGELKNTFCPAKDDLFYPSPYIGDMEDVRSHRALRESAERLCRLLEIKPSLIACDLHPDYHTSAIARSMGLPLMRIQHHYAHILSCMAESDFRGTVIGVSMDGTGYGTDGTIWGGEFLIASPQTYQRRGHIAPFLQPGGDAASREGWRIASAMLCHTPEMIAPLDLCSDMEQRVMQQMLLHRFNTVVSTSTGRLFDGIAAILGLRKTSTFEGEAAMALQFAAAAHAGTVPDLLPEEQYLSAAGETFQLRTDLLTSEIARRRIAGDDCRMLAAAFHRTLAQMIAAGCRFLRHREGIRVCALSGGVFQNTLLLEQCLSLLEGDDFTVLRHRLIPPNDGGIALGQAFAAMAQLNSPDI